MEVERIGPHTLYRADCREVLDELRGVDAVVTDPNYGIGEAAGKNKRRGRFENQGARLGLKEIWPPKDYGNKDWDDGPVPHDLMMQVIGLAKYAAVFGGNYYRMPPTSCVLVWDKCNGKTDFADCELIWTNFPGAVRRLQFRWNGLLRENGETRGDHPTQKPVGIMSWVIGHIPGEPKSIADPFMGSGTTGVACANAGIKFIGVEREQEYFDKACLRIEYAESQLRLFA